MLRLRESIDRDAMAAGDRDSSIYDRCTCGCERRDHPSGRCGLCAGYADLSRHCAVFVMAR